jgi:hypothetical protein
MRAMLEWLGRRWGPSVAHNATPSRPLPPKGEGARQRYPSGENAPGAVSVQT